ncbi:hypothetical protein OIU78_023657 [Salix suchowensis]|nr:hypothetical protein OIU78_023657 [Salix suchowensis]
MALRRPAMNRSCNRENPDILIVMIAEKQIMRGDEDDKERETMGPQKPAREMSGTAPKRSLHILSTGVVQTTLSSVYKVCWSTLYYRVCLLLGDHHSANVNKLFRLSRLKSALSNTLERCPMKEKMQRSLQTNRQ